MSISKERLEKIMHLLRNHCIDGYLHFRIWRKINESFKSMPEKQEQFSLFMKMSWHAHDDSAISYLIRLLDRDSESIGIPYLLRTVKGNLHLFEFGTKSKILETVEKDKLKLDGELNELLESLKAHRNLNVAHLDKSIVKDDFKAEHVNPLTRVDVEKLYKSSGEILNHYHKFLTNGTWDMEYVIKEYTVDWLFKFIDENID